ncbi:PIG-L deacetylase family protein [Maribellus maritimus]|uniref:PIG-L deacetylase family protein n=1 Tax=Maribellus maritimus TaxID=2870838 RepID=UPI001EECBBBC|nr:PIG-L family deacetylase [Maribellus maritimus]MCG6191272.1 PIG-L family deacetylase [Maribellus maritimus]
MDEITSKNVAVIVAHPDDETLWAGGTILSHPSWNCFIISLCRGNDEERAPKFYEALKILGAEGAMGTLDDSPEQIPLNIKIVEQAILDLLPVKNYNLIISHNPSGEYTRHIRHEEVSKAVVKLWYNQKIFTDELWNFAYEDGKRKYYPRPEIDAAIYHKLTERIWKRKYNMITETYGFDENSWEAKTTPKDEAFRQFTNSFTAVKWLNNGGVYL